MKFERLKSILLISLVISSIVLTVNKWFNQKLWPEGYNFFSNVKNYFVYDNNSEPQVSYSVEDHILNPSKIILNNSGQHILYSINSPMYVAIASELKELLEYACLDDEFVLSDINEWNNVLKSKSCYFSYPVKYDSDFFFSKLSDKYKVDFESIKEFAICGDSLLPSVMYVYVKEASSGDVYKKRIEFDSEIILDEIETCRESDDEMSYYSFELNFDIESQNQLKDSIIIEPDVLINISMKKVPSITENNLFVNVSENPRLYNKILEEFGYNASSIRKYIENDNSMVFVENYGTLKFHTNGVLAYKALDYTNGVELSQNSVYDCINSCITIVDSITESLNFSSEMHCEMSSDIVDFTSNTFKLVLDYYIDDNMIAVPADLYNMEHAIEIEVESGKMVSYKQLCLSFESENDFILCSSAIDAIDSIHVDDGASFKRISDVFIAYTYNKNNKTWNPLWYIEDSNGDISTVITDSE